MQYMICVLTIVLLSLLINEKFDRMVERREPARLYVAKSPWGEWTRQTPEGYDVHIALHTATREGKFLWVVRRDGEYLDDEIEYATDKELSLEEGLSFIAKQDSAKRRGEALLAE